MAKKPNSNTGTIGSLDPADVERVNALKTANGFANNGEAVALLLDEYEGVHGSIMDEEGNVTLDEGEVAGLTEAKRINARMMKEIERLLVRRHELQTEAVDEQTAKIEELTAQVAERDETIAERDKTIAEQATELEDLRAKAASVDTLSERIDTLVKTFDRQAERYEADLSATEGRLGQMTEARDVLAEQLKATEAERDSLAREVERLTAELAEAKAE